MAKKNTVSKEEATPKTKKATVDIALDACQDLSHDDLNRVINHCRGLLTA